MSDISGINLQASSRFNSIKKRSFDIVKDRFNYAFIQFIYQDISSIPSKIKFFIQKGEIAPMYGIPDRLKALSAAEEQVLLALWDCKPPVSRRDIGARLAEKGWAAATVLNFLYRLEEKGWVTCTKEQNHNLYAPTVTRRAYGVYTMRQRLDTVFGGDLAQAVRALVSESGCSQSELEQAIAVLNEKHAESEEYDLYDPYG